MAAVRKPFGFKPSRSLNGNFNPRTNRYTADTGGLFPGDPVTLVSGLNVSIATTATPVLGIVAQCLDTNQKPLVFSQPTRGPFLPPSTAGFVDVYIDPDNVYWIATATTALATHVGLWAKVSALGSANANNRVGRSPIGLQLADAAASSAGVLPWKILGPSPMQRDYLTQADWVEGVEVVLHPTLAGQS
jgi:hypothetical protein